MKWNLYFKWFEGKENWEFLESFINYDKMIEYMDEHYPYIKQVRSEFIWTDLEESHFMLKAEKQ